MSFLLPLISGFANHTSKFLLDIISFVFQGKNNSPYAEVYNKFIEAMYFSNFIYAIYICNAIDSYVAIYCFSCE